MKKCNEKTNKEGILDAIKYPVHLITCLSPCTTLRFTDDTDFVPKTKNKICRKCGCHRKEKGLRKNCKEYLSGFDNTPENKQPSLEKVKSQTNVTKKKENDICQESSLVVEQSVPNQINLNACIHCSNLPVCEQKLKQEVNENIDTKYTNSSMSIKIKREKSEDEVSKPLRVSKKTTKGHDVKKKRGYVTTSQINKTASYLTINNSSQENISEPVKPKITKLHDVKKKRGYVITSQINKTPSCLTIIHSSQDHICEPVKPKNVMPYIIDSMVCRCDQNRINCPTYPKYERNCVSNDSIYEPRRCDKNNFVQTPQIINNCSCDKNFDSIKCTCPKKQETDKLINCECEPKNKKISSCACIPPKEPIVSCSCTKKSEKIIQRCESHAQTDLKYLDLRIILPSSTGSTQTDEEKINIKILENKGCSPFKTEDITKFKKLDDKGISPIKTEDKTNLKKLEDKGSSPIQIEDKKSPQIKIEEKSPRKDDKIQFPIGVEDKRSSLISVKSDKYDSKSSNNRYKEYIMLEPERPPSQPRTPQSQPTTSQSEPTTPQSQPTTPKKKRRKKSKEKKKKGLFGSKSKAKIETTPAYTMPCIELNSMNNLEQILKLSSIIQSKNEEINRLNSIVCSNQSPFRNLNDQPQTIKIVFEHLPCNSMTQIKEITPASPSHPRQLSKDNSPKKETPI